MNLQFLSNPRKKKKSKGMKKNPVEVFSVKKGRKPKKVAKYLTNKEKDAVRLEEKKAAKKKDMVRVRAARKVMLDSYKQTKKADRFSKAFAKSSKKDGRDIIRKEKDNVKAVKAMITKKVSEDPETKGKKAKKQALRDKVMASLEESKAARKASKFKKSKSNEGGSVAKKKKKSKKKATKRKVAKKKAARKSSKKRYSKKRKSVKRKSVKRKSSRKAAKRKSVKRRSSRRRKSAKRGNLVKAKEVVIYHSKQTRKGKKVTKIAKVKKRKGKKSFMEVFVRRNPVAALKKGAEFVLPESLQSVKGAAAVVGGAVAYGLLKGKIDKVAAEQIVARVPALAPVAQFVAPLLALTAAGAAKKFVKNAQVREAADTVQLLVVATLAIEMAQKHLAPMIPGLSGVDYTPMAGVDYTPMNGVDYTPMAGVPQLSDMGGIPQGLGYRSADFGSFDRADYGGGVELSKADFGGIADVEEDSVYDSEAQDQMG